MKRLFAWLAFLLFGVGDIVEEARRAGIIK